MSVRAEDFSSPVPPQRPIGSEVENNVQPPADGSVELEKIIETFGMQKRGINNHFIPRSSQYLGAAYGGGKVCIDVGHIEYCTRVELGPAAAAIADIDGIGHMNAIVVGSGVEHGGVYRMSGTYIPDGRIASRNDADKRTSSGTTSGYHQNFLTTRDVANSKLMDAVVPTALASGQFAMSGTIRNGAFVMSQKAWGIGDTPVDRTFTRRVMLHKKPMVMVPSPDTDCDTIGDSDFARVEVRMVDPGLSAVGTYLGYAGTSLALRAVELQHILGAHNVKKVCLKDPVKAAMLYAEDLTFTHKEVTHGGLSVTSLDAQEGLLDLYESFTGKGIELPEDEKLAIVAIRSLVDALRASNPAEADYTATARSRIDFVSRHQFVSRRKNGTPIALDSAEAMKRNLLWDRIQPAGYGLLYWSRMNEIDPLAAQVRNMAARAGTMSRESQRAAIIDDPANFYNNGSHVISWTQYKDESGEVHSLTDPAGD